MSFNRINGFELLDLSPSLIFAPADDPRRAEVKLNQISLRMQIGRIQPHRLFELAPGLSRRGKRGEPTGLLRLPTVSPPEPQTVLGIVWLQLDRLFGAGCGEIKLPQLKVTSGQPVVQRGDRKSTRLNSSHGYISYAVFCLKKKKNKNK